MNTTIPSPLLTDSVCLNCLIDPPPWRHCQAALPYRAPWSTLIGAFKYHGEAGLVGFLSAQMQAHTPIQNLIQQAHFLLPVPLSSQRLKDRGYNQSQLLSQKLSREKTHADILIRLRDTPSQASLSREARQHNLDHAVVCHPNFRSLLQGQRVVLIDDVLTTGSTLRACTEALKSAQVAQVDCIVLARATGPVQPQ